MPTARLSTALRSLPRPTERLTFRWWTDTNADALLAFRLWSDGISGIFAKIGYVFCERIFTAHLRIFCILMLPSVCFLRIYITFCSIAIAFLHISCAFAL